MGRKKIVIKQIHGSASRRATFEKRRIGLLKKAMELSILCDARISLTIERKDEGDLQLYASEPFDEIIERYQRFEGTYRLFTNDHILNMIPGKNSSNNVGYQVRKQGTVVPQIADFDMDINGNVKMTDHATFQRSQMTQMEIVPNAPSPSMNNALYSQYAQSSDSRLLPILSPQPTFNGYQPAQAMAPRFQFMDSRHSLPVLPKRSFDNMMIINEGDSSFDNADNDILGPPPMKRLKVDSSNNTTINTSDTSTLSASPPPMPRPMPRLSVTPPDVELLDLAVPDACNGF